MHSSILIYVHYTQKHSYIEIEHKFQTQNSIHCSQYTGVHYVETMLKYRLKTGPEKTVHYNEGFYIHGINTEVPTIDI